MWACAELAIEQYGPSWQRQIIKIWCKGIYCRCLLDINVSLISSWPLFGCLLAASGTSLSITEDFVLAICAQTCIEVRGGCCPVLGSSRLAHVEAYMKKLQKALLSVVLCAWPGSTHNFSLPDLMGLTCMALPVALPPWENFLSFRLFSHPACASFSLWCPWPSMPELSASKTPRWALSSAVINT